MNTNFRLSESVKRILSIDLEGNNAFFLWGARKTGKTTFLKQNFSEAKYYDLLDTDLKTKLVLRPKLLREEILGNEYSLVIVDEVQKVPELLDEIHWCLENTETKFILCGSSARKLKRNAANLLGGRAWRYELFPLTTEEIKDIDLKIAFNNGLLPQHYFSTQPEKFLQGYILDYLNEEILQEAQIRNLPAFSKFLEAAAIGNGQLLNYANVARDCGVSAKTVKEYYQILNDTLIGYTLKPWIKSYKRRLIETEKFYFIDLGIVRALRGMQLVQKGTMEYGWAFEQFLICEIKAYIVYSNKYEDLAFWRSSTGLEVDLIIGKMKVAIEFKAKENVRSTDLKGLSALKEEHPQTTTYAITLDCEKRKLENGTMIYPWRLFCDELWQGRLI